jgi:hypothetical protein
MVNYAFVNGEEQEAGEAGSDEKQVATQTPVVDVVVVARNAVTVKEGALAKDLNRADEITVENNEDLLEATDLQGRLKTGLKAVQTAGEKYFKPFFNQYKSILNITNTAKSHVEPRIKKLQNKMDSFATLQEVERRKKEQEAKDKAADLQKKIDDEAAELARKAKATAKKSKAVYVPPPRIVVDAPVIPKTIEARTEHGTSKLDTVLIGEVTDFNSDFVRQLMIDYCMPAFRTLAQVAVDKAINAGALGLKGADGVTVTEKTTVKHRRK